MIAKRKRHVPIKPSIGCVAKAVRFFYTDLADTSNDDPEFAKSRSHRKSQEELVLVVKRKPRKLE